MTGWRFGLLSLVTTARSQLSTSQTGDGIHHQGAFQQICPQPSQFLRKLTCKEPYRMAS